MKRITDCFRFQLVRSRRMIVIMLGYYLLFYGFFLAISKLDASGIKNTSLNFYFITIAVIFSFVLSIVSYVGFFNSLLLFGNTRRTIFASQALHGVFLAALFAVLSLLSDIFNPWLGGVLHFRSYQFISQLVYPAVREASLSGALLWSLWYFALLCCLMAVGLVYGTLMYKFGKTFMVVFWVGFGFLFSFFSILISGQFGKTLIKALKWYFAAQGSMAAASLHFLATAVLLGAVAWLIARRQEMRTEA